MPTTDEVSRVIVMIHAGVLALVCALIGGSGLLLMTVWLLLKGGPHLGAHLQLLGQLFIGYSVTWTGSVIRLRVRSVDGGVSSGGLSVPFTTVLLICDSIKVLLSCVRVGTKSEGALCPCWI